MLRPTTRSPVLVCAAADVAAFSGDRVLPHLPRVTGGPGGPGTVQLVVREDLPPGLALLDAPDVDSVVEANRDLAGQLLAAADLWVFVTTAARYADAVPWDLLRTAQERGTALAVVLDRVPPEATAEVAADLGGMLQRAGLSGARLFVIEERPLREGGLLPEEQVAPLRAWLHALAADQGARAAVVRQTLTGALDSLTERVAHIAVAVEAQDAAAVALHAAAQAAYDAARAGVDDGVRNGSLLRGEVLARWQEFVGTGEWMRSPAGPGQPGPRPGRRRPDRTARTRRAGAGGGGEQRRAAAAGRGRPRRRAHGHRVARAARGSGAGGRRGARARAGVAGLPGGGRGAGPGLAGRRARPGPQRGRGQAHPGPCALLGRQRRGRGGDGRGVRADRWSDRRRRSRWPVARPPSASG